MNHDAWLEKSIEVIKMGGVLAYPTEQCFGLGCDPSRETAIERILKMKQRHSDQGLILIASEAQQLDPYVDFSVLSSKQRDSVFESWPGPHTWLVPCHAHVSSLIRGKHSSVAVRVTADKNCRLLLQALEHPLISTSANRTGQESIISAHEVEREFANEVDYIVTQAVGGASKPSSIRDAITGVQLR